MPPKMDSRVFITLESFENSYITIVEWETPLLNRLAHPLVADGDLAYLVPDDQIQLANNIAVVSGLRLAKDDDFRRRCLTQYVNQGTLYAHGNPKRRFILAPLSWTGIERDELSIVTPPVESIPCTIWTVPLSSCCAAYLRIIMQESKNSRVRDIASADLSGIIAYGMFGMTYEGSYMKTPEDDPEEDNDKSVDFLDEAAWKEKDALEMRDVLCKIRGWQFKMKDEWLRDMLIQLVSGNLRYEALPSRETQQGGTTEPETGHA
ncbi:hypothetical protein CKAH01_07243 [Colletotrichum kahawae]|uniref:Uncharacterized protein n=1 Tax=Colletotrichum kahawae TaxID=34407 RepID=A0AAE0D1W4_COLKA|nr:hypothetical protein CKAH01_07243 [Colletotrichum kahawae]